MASNNPCKSGNNHSRKVTLLHRSQEISSLEDSESTLSNQDGSMKQPQPTTIKNQQNLPISFPSSVYNDTAQNTDRSFQQQDSTTHNTVHQNDRMVTYQSPMNFTPNPSHHTHFQHNFSPPPYVPPTSGITMHQYHGMNLHNLSQPMHPCHRTVTYQVPATNQGLNVMMDPNVSHIPFQTYPPFQQGSSIHSMPYGVLTGQLATPINHHHPQHFSPVELPKKKRKNKPNERRIQRFKEKAARHQKALALGMALLNSMEQSKSKKETFGSEHPSNDSNHSTTCLVGAKNKTQNTPDAEVSNISFDMNDNGIGSISNINITKIMYGKCC